MPAPVALRACETYDPEQVDVAVDAALADVGGLASYVAAGETVLLKPNLIAATPPSQAATTHPAVLDTLCRRILELGGKPVIGDAPAWSGPEAVGRATGITEVCERYDIPFWYFDRHARMSSKHPGIAARFHVDPRVLEVDKLINVGKLKAHQQLGFTCCMKNLYGCLAGREKAYHHFARSKTDHRFALYLAAFQDSLPVTLNIADAVIAMEGPGPRLGTPRPMGFVAASRSAVAIDAVMAAIIAAPATHRLMLDAAAELGLLDPQETIEILGDPAERFTVMDFKHPALLGVFFSPLRIIRGWAKNRRMLKAGG